MYAEFHEKSTATAVRPGGVIIEGWHFAHLSSVAQLALLVEAASADVATITDPTNIQLAGFGGCSLSELRTARKKAGLTKARKAAGASLRRQTRIAERSLGNPASAPAFTSAPNSTPKPSPVAATIATAEALAGFRKLAHAGRLGSGFFKNLSDILKNEEIAAGARLNGNGNGAGHHYPGV
jgi:hypothetical protein